MTYKLSLVMICKNEALHLANCLNSVRDIVDEIIILDSGSSDKTQEIAQSFGAKFYTNTDWQGFGVQRQRAQALASGDWILVLDADEIPDEKMRQALKNIKQEKPANKVYGLCRLDYFCGHLVDFPNKKAHFRLYPQKFTFNDNLVHESLDCKDGQKALLDGFLHHYGAEDVPKLIEKRLQYAINWAQQNSTRKKISFWQVYAHYFLAFFKHYFLKGRFLRGFYGKAYARLFAQYTFNKYALLYDRQHNSKTYLSKSNIEITQKNNILSKNTYKTSLVMICKNEEFYLQNCLQNVSEIVDEIIILDSGSSDKTGEIAKSFGAKFHKNTDWQGFGVQRQRAQALASGDWILVLDADEFPDAQLIENIKRTIQNSPNSGKVYAFQRQELFCGRKINHKKHKFARLYGRDFFQFHSYPVHESLDSKNAQIIVLNGTLQHYYCRNLEHFLLKNQRYAHIWGADKAQTKNNLSGRALISFWREYFLRGAIFAGVYGYFLSRSVANYTFNKYLISNYYAQQQRQNTL